MNSNNQNMSPALSNQSGSDRDDILIQGQPLSDFVMQLEDYTPTVSTFLKLQTIILKL